MTRHYEVTITIPLPDDYFARADVVSRVKPACEALAAGLAKAKIEGLKIQAREVVRKTPRVAPPEPAAAAPAPSNVLPLSQPGDAA